MKSIDFRIFRTNWIPDFLPIGSLWLETSATALRGPYVIIRTLHENHWKSPESQPPWSTCAFLSEGYGYPSYLIYAKKTSFNCLGWLVLLELFKATIQSLDQKKSFSISTSTSCELEKKKQLVPRLHIIGICTLQNRLTTDWGPKTGPTCATSGRENLVFDGNPFDKLAMEQGQYKISFN